MTIRIRLTLLFMALVGSILLLFSVSVYHLYDRYREREFRKQISETAHTVVRMLSESDDFSTQAMHQFLQADSAQFASARLIVYTPDNRMIWRSVGKGFNGQEDLVLSTTLLDQIRSGQKVFRQAGSSTIMGILCGACRNEKLIVSLAATDDYGRATLLRLRQILLSGWLASLLLVGLAGWLFAGDMLRPISGIIQQVKAISATNIHARLDVGREKDELSGLAVTFNRMLTRLEKAFVSQKSFVAQASHELRTPLTVMTGQIEVALMRSRTPDEYRMALEGTLHEVRKMNRLVNGLLDLANANTDASRLPFKPVRADELLWQARTEVLNSSPDCQIDILYDNLPEQEEYLVVTAVEALLRTAFQNLMKYSCQRTAHHPMQISLASQPNNLVIYFTISDLHIPSQNLPHLFDPFFRPDDETSDSGECAVGLALVNRVIDLHKGRIEVISSLKNGTTFQVTLPIQPVAASHTPPVLMSV